MYDHTGRKEKKDSEYFWVPWQSMETPNFLGWKENYPSLDCIELCEYRIPCN